MRFKTNRFNEKIISALSLFFIIFLIVYSKTSMKAVKDGLSIWINNVVPSLFPFFIATEILINTNIINIIGKMMEKPFSKIFNVSGEGSFALLMGTICGYPSGAKIVTDLRDKNIITLEEAERLIAFTNNSGPLFIIGVVGISMLNSPHLGYILLISHLISCIIVGIIFRNWKKYKKSERINRFEKNIKVYNNKNVGEILNDSIIKSIISVVNIGGFIVFFSIIISIIDSTGILKIVEICSRKLNFSDSIRKIYYIWHYRVNKWYEKF